MKKFINDELYAFKILLRSVPGLVTTIFLLSVVLMNLLANKELSTSVDWLVIDCGLLISWVAFLIMDMVAKHFGSKASIRLSILSIAVNLCVCAVLYIISKLQGNWSAYYIYTTDAVNQALNTTFGGTWFVVIGSMVAFGCSAVVNSVLNSSIGKCFKTDNYKAYAVRCYVSTILGQFVDNMIFALLVSHTFFGWSILQCFVCSLTGCLFEVIGEIIFTPISYRICNYWKVNRVGEDYTERCL